jgi:pyridine nucleotide-disulfide oxidoreductase family protein
MNADSDRGFEKTMDHSHTEPVPLEDSRGYQPRQMVLLGAGHAHLHVLEQLAASPLVGARINLVAPQPHQLYSGMLPGFVAGRYTLEECVLHLEPLVRRAGIRWLTRSVRGLDANTQTILFDDGSTLHYDWLSVNTGPVQNRSRIEASMPGAREHALFVRPLETFAALWPKVAEMGSTQALRIAVIGAGAAGVELAFAVRQRLPNAAITLLTGDAAAGGAYPPKAQSLMQAALKARRITLIQDNAVGVSASEVLLQRGARLACDVPLIAIGAQAPPWLESSGLALDQQGFIAVDAHQRSTSHTNVFAAGDVSTRMDRPLARSGVYAVRAGPALAHNLAAVVAGQNLKTHQPPGSSLNLLSCGDGKAIATYGSLSIQGRWAWWLKDSIDRKFARRYADGA